MIQTTLLSVLNPPSRHELSAIVQFLFTELGQYGDQKKDIEKACKYALMNDGSDGGFIIVAHGASGLAGAAVVNKTGMEGYIPENILVYIATHRECRGKGIASKLMQEVINVAQGNIALHVEPDNPAISLYRKFGFNSKYLEMRLHKEEGHGIRNA